MPQTHEEEFDWDDFMRDTLEASAAVTGAWLRCLYKMRFSVTQGRISWPITSYMRLFGMAQDQAKKVIEELSTLGIGDAVTESNGNITLTNRRMYRAFQEREGNRNRQAAFRERQASEPRNGKVTKPKNPTVVVEEVIKEKRVRKDNGTRIPDPFPLSDEMIEWATANCPGLHLIEAHENFVEYYTNCTTSKAYRLNWRLTWQKGMKLALKWQNNENRKPEQKLPTVEEKIAAEAEYRAAPKNDPADFMRGVQKQRQDDPPISAGDRPN